MTNIFIFESDLTPDGKLKKQYPDIDGAFDCSSIKITSLVGSPVNVGRGFDCSATNITSLIGASITINGNFNAERTKITSLQGIGRDYSREIGDTLYLNRCFNLKSQLLGIMLIKNLKGIEFNSNTEVQDIFNKHLARDRDLLDCKEELMNAGFKEFAKL